MLRNPWTQRLAWSWLTAKPMHVREREREGNRVRDWERQRERERETEGGREGDMDSKHKVAHLRAAMRTGIAA